MYRAQFESNARGFQRALERIAEKYSKVQYEHDAVEVDLDNTRIGRLEHYMRLSEKNLDKLQSMSFADSREETSLQDITKYPEIDTSCKEKSGNFETTSLSEVTQNDAESYTRPREESQRNYTLLSDQPEDQDEELEVSLQSRGSSLGECYQGMVSQIENAWRRQHVSEAADSVRRRYRRWRKSTRMHCAESFHDVHRHNKEKSQQELSMKHHRSLDSPVKSVASTVTKAVSPSPVKNVTVNGQKSQYHCSPVRRSEAPVVVMDMAAIDKESKSVFNKTFTVSEPSLLYSTFSSSPSRSCYSPNRPCQDLIFKMKSMSPHCMQTTSSSVHASPVLKGIYSSPVKTSPYNAKLTSRGSFNEWADIYSSPKRKSPFKLHANKESTVQSPYAHVASPKSPYMRQSFSKEFKRSNFVPSPSKLAFPRRTLEYPEDRLSAQHWSPQLDKPRRPHYGLRRCLSFDSSTQPLSRPFYSSKDFDNDFIKLYHKLVCLNKSSFLKGHPCRFCAKNSEASRGHSLSNLAALALSPHRPLLRKRHGDVQNYPHSKRYRDDHIQPRY